MVLSTELNNGTYITQLVLNNGTYIIDSILNNGSYVNTNLVNWADANNGTILDVNKVEWADVGNGTLATADSIWTTLSNGTMVLSTELNNGTYITQLVLNNGTYIIDSILNNGSYVNTDLVNWADANNGTILDVNKVEWADVNNGTITAVETLWNANYTNLLTDCGSSFVKGIFVNGTFQCDVGGNSDATWVANWTAYNTTWSTDTDTFVANYSDFLDVQSLVTNNTFLQLSGGNLTGNLNITTNNITTQGSGVFYSNATCIFIKGDTSLMEIC
jgi:hypothetical protein